MISVMLIVLVSCGNKTAGISYESTIADDAPFHADNDIAMAVCSIVDAVRVGEVLDSLDYNFDGILTDGQGTPLYTDLEGNPGEWQVRVLGSDKARIRNLHFGDLMTEDLRTYILNALNLNSADLVTAYINPSNDQETIWLYDIGDVDVSFSETVVDTPTDPDGIIMSISVAKK